MADGSLWGLFSNREALIALVESWGPWAPPVFIGLQAVQVVLWVIPGELTGIVGGYLFGTWLGFGYSMIGLTAGSLITFWLGQRLGHPFLSWAAGERRYARLRALTNRAGAPVAFVLYLIPGFPKDVLGYFFGASDLSAVTFVVVTALARAPGTWVLSLQGAKAGEQAWHQLAVITLGAVILAAVAWWYRDRILARVRRRRHPAAVLPEDAS